MSKVRTMPTPIPTEAIESIVKRVRREEKRKAGIPEHDDINEGLAILFGIPYHTDDDGVVKFDVPLPTVYVLEDKIAQFSKEDCNDALWLLEFVDVERGAFHWWDCGPDLIACIRERLAIIEERE